MSDETPGAGEAGGNAAGDEVIARKGGTSREDVKAYAKAGGSAAAAAGCAALGAPAAAPVCATVGGFVAGAIAGALFDAFSNDDEAERAKQEARSAAWYDYAQGTMDYVREQQAMILRAVNTFFAENWQALADARVPCYATPWGPQRFRDVFNSQQATPAPHFDSQTLEQRVIPMITLCAPRFGPAWRALAEAWGRVYDNSVAGTFGDDTEAARKSVRERNAAIFEESDVELKAALADVLQQWATSGALYEIKGGREADLAAAARRRQAAIDYAEDWDPARKKQHGSIAVPLGLAAGVGLLWALRRKT